MDQTNRISPKDFFLHLASIVALYVSASSLLVLLFQIINLAFPDALSGRYFYYNPYGGPIRFAIASLIIIFPLYLYLVNILNKDYAINPAKRSLGVRKWLMYLTLFIAGAVVVGDLIALLNTFLGGEITVRFILKCLAVLVVSGLIFGYYLRDLKSEAALPLKERRAFRYGTIVLVLAAIVTGFVVMGSPGKQRLLKFDAQKVQDLQGIQWQIVNYWQTKQALPASLQDLTDSIGGYAAPIDPETGDPYIYKPTGNTSFDLCANFNLPSDAKSEARDLSMTKPMGYGMIEENWQHEAGLSCFNRTIDPERYPPHPPTRF